MLKRIQIERFKSIVDMTIDLGRVNVFIGANGSGKSNLLEAIGVLGAAASGRVDDESLLRRGVRPGVPGLYKTAFRLTKSVPHIRFGAHSSENALYEVTLWNPLADPSPAWRYKSEKLCGPDGQVLASRNPVKSKVANQEVGVAALEAVRTAATHPAARLITELREYAIYCPNTPTLRGLAPDVQNRAPVGLSGGRLPEAILELWQSNHADLAKTRGLESVFDLIDWARSFRTRPSGLVPLSPSASRTANVIEFTDRHMLKARNRLTGYDASEGALYVLFYAALALHPQAPSCLAVDNLDQALNPRLAQRVAQSICEWTKLGGAKQWLVTAHNPAVLDGLPLQDDGVRLFAVDRNSEGHTQVRRIDVPTALAKRPDESWTLSRMWMNGLLGAVPNV
ncbi:MAG: AAA family ATPase [Sandaracinus sp.]